MYEKATGALLPRELKKHTEMNRPDIRNIKFLPKTSSIAKYYAQRSLHSGAKGDD